VRRSAALTLLVTLLLAPLASAETWQTFQPEGGGFSVSFPGPATHHQQTVEGLVMHNYVATSGGYGYSVSYTQFPAEAIPAGEERALMRTYLESVAGQVKASKVDTTEVTLQQHKGIEYLMSSGQVEARGRLFLVKGRLFDLMAAGKAGSLGGGPVEKFLASFTLVP
jgi:hypothetical protein